MINLYMNNLSKYILICFLTFNLFGDDLSKEQIEKIKEATQDYFKAPNFTLKSTNDSLYVLSDMKGKVVLLNFWATWCGPCRMEIPDLNDLYDVYKNKGLEIFGISISDTKEQLIQFLKSYDVKYPLLYGNTYEMQKVLSDYGAGYSVPVSFLINTEGDLIRGYPGAILKDYNPGMYTDLIYNIESSLPNNSDNEQK